MVSQRAYLYDRFVSLNDRFIDLLNHRTKQKLMIEKTFEKKWADNRQRLLQEDEEYQRILRSYRKHNWADALVAPAALIGSMEFVAWLGVKSQVLNFVISLVLAIVFFFVSFISRLSGSAARRSTRWSSASRRSIVRK